MMKKEIREIVKQLETQGWTITQGKGHIKAFPPDKSKAPVVIPTTPGRGRWRQNLEAQIRRSGGAI